LLYTSQPIYAPAAGGGTDNLTPDQQQITTLGQANVRFKFAGQEASFGRQLIIASAQRESATKLVQQACYLGSNHFRHMRCSLIRLTSGYDP
jgi:hypothetical protein